MEVVNLEEKKLTFLDALSKTFEVFGAGYKLFLGFALVLFLLYTILPILFFACLLYSFGSIPLLVGFLLVFIQLFALTHYMVLGALSKLSYDIYCIYPLNIFDEYLFSTLKSLLPAVKLFFRVFYWSGGLFLMLFALIYPIVVFGFSNMIPKYVPFNSLFALGILIGALFVVVRSLKACFSFQFLMAHPELSSNEALEMSIKASDKHLSMIFLYYVVFGIVMSIITGTISSAFGGTAFSSSYNYLPKDIYAFALHCVVYSFTGTVSTVMIGIFQQVLGQELNAKKPYVVSTLMKVLLSLLVLLPFALIVGGFVLLLFVRR